MRPRFWERFALCDLNNREWEALCDRCGRCCLLKFHTTDDSQVTFTNLSCRLLNTHTCRCKHYASRNRIVSDCVTLRPDDIEQVITWMPPTCAYRLVHEKRPLFDWHHLISGDANSVHEAGISVRNRCIPEYEGDSDNLERHAVEWPQHMA
ncbi:MAG: YcgN family cysteine cluster protein [Rhodobacteraceae bacterium]|nr:YcgN family cysteine cluster protein [Paracoccaceae bacterium]MCY4328164.1 YcgN family cysteine cluster protein [Paracoccaceae bacterium]